MTTHRHHEPFGASVWVTCATCWGQRRLLTPGPEGELTPSLCPSCLGIGERLADRAHAARPPTAAPPSG
jgi:hypothetical protein